MAWRVLVDGPMIEVVNGVQTLPDGSKREQTSIEIPRAQTVITKDLSESMRIRYEANDPYVRSIVEYGEIQDVEVTTDNGQTITQPQFVPTGAAPEEAASPATDEEALAEIERLEGEVDDKQKEIDDLTAQLAEAKDAAASPDVVRWDALSPEALTAEAQKRGVYDSIKGSGANDNIVKADLVSALTTAQEKASGS